MNTSVPTVRRRAWSIWSIAALLICGACGSRDPLEQVVSLPTANRLAIWRAHVASGHDPGLVLRIEEALHEIRLAVSGDRELKRQAGEKVEGGTAAIDEAVRQRIHERKLREVLQLGGELRLRRLKDELAGLEKAMNRNAQLVTRPDDIESRHHLEGLHDRQLVRVEQYRSDLAATERDLAPLMARSGRTLLEPATSGSQPPQRIRDENRSSL